MRALVLALLLAGCRVDPPLPPSPGPGDCSTAAANLAKLGGCGVDLAAFPAQCEGATKAEEGLGVRWPAHCITLAPDCQAAWECR